VVRLAFKSKRYAPREKSAETLSRATRKAQLNRVVRQAGCTPPLGNFAAQDRPNGAADVGNRHRERCGFSLLNVICELLDQKAINRVMQAMVLLLCVTPANMMGQRWIIEYGRKIDSTGFPMFDIFALHQAIHAADHLVHGTETKLGHDLSQV